MRTEATWPWEITFDEPWNDELTLLFLWFAALLFIFGVALFGRLYHLGWHSRVPGRLLMGSWLIMKGTLGVFGALAFGSPFGIDDAPSIKTWVIWLGLTNILGTWCFFRYLKRGLDDDIPPHMQ